MNFRICALDDDESILFTLDAMAKTQGWEFKGTTVVEQCLEWARQRDADMLLLDYHMPYENGLDVLRKVKILAPSLPVLIITIEQHPEIAEELLIAGAEDFINKPLRLADFVSRINLHRRLRPQKKKEDKGIGQEKLERVISYLKKRAEPAEIDEVAAQCGMSYTTTHRYLDHLAKNGLVTSMELSRSGKQGRPSRSYMFVGLAPPEGRG